MDEIQIKELLTKIPGAKRAANGVIIPGEDGTFWYGVKILKKEEMNGLTEEETFFVGFCAKSEIIRLRSLKNAHDYLLRIRAYAIVDKMRAYRVMLARKQKYTANGKPWSLSNYYHSKDYYHKSYIDRLFPRDSKRVKKLPSGLAFIQEANAICMRSLGAKSPLSDASLNECLEVSQQLTELFVEDVKCGVSDILTFYGSIYLPSYTKRMRKDRIEF
jgi:hypothetical protein